MSLILDTQEPAIVRGIKTVGVGKKGSKPLSAELAVEIAQDLRAGKVAPAAKGAFFAGLLAKRIEPQEEILMGTVCHGDVSPEALVQHIAADAPEFVRWVCVSLLKGSTLDKQTAYDLGKFLFSDEPGDGARGLVASFLRVRYETDDEYQGLWQAMQETVTPAFSQPAPAGDPIVQLAEPFDGIDHSYMVTPLIAQYIQQLGFRAIHLVGRNAGPKLVFNLMDVVKLLPGCFAGSAADLAGPKPNFGWFVAQKDVSPALDRWVDLRRQIVKRPFLATLEKFLKPAAADILVTSAFHPPYGEKMLTIAERAGFPGAMVIRNGIEGSMGFALKRPVKILLSARQKGGDYQRHEITFDPQAFLGAVPAVEETREQLSAKENARLIQVYANQGQTGDQWFDLRVKATCEGFRQGLEWLKQKDGTL